jgi:predicted TIM-barrel fold metal-dependent hydrolase
MLFSGDAHVQEPGDLFTRRLPFEQQLRAPVWHRFDDGTKLWSSNGMARFLAPDYQRTKPDGSWEVVPPEPAEKYVADLEADGVAGTMMHGNIGISVFNIDDPALALRCAQIYNDYVAETYLSHPRLFPMPLIPLLDIDDALGEVERVLAMGFRGLSIPMSAPRAVGPYFSPRYDPLWAKASEHRLPLVAHIGSGNSLGRQGRSLIASFGADAPRRDDPDRQAALVAAKLRTGGFGGYTGGQAPEMIQDLVGGGVLERFPELHFLIVEVGARWILNLMDGMDDSWYQGPGVREVTRTYYDANGVGRTLPDPDAIDLEWPYPLLPSDYVKRQIHVTFMDDWRALRNRHLTGIDCLVWGSDYPHYEASWPKSVEAVRRQVELSGLTAGEEKAIFGGTLCTLLGVNADDLMAAV